jgi:hypothetical protein
MDIAASATANAISLEVKKDGLTQRQSGDWQIRFTVAALDMDQKLSSAPMGTRYACVLVEINDDETPVDHRAQDRDKWRQIGPTKQAGIRCSDPVFWAYLEEELHFKVENSDHAAAAVRQHCGIESRRDLEKPGKQIERLRWFELDNAFQAWRARENA